MLPVRGFRILANSMATPYVTEPLLETVDLRGLFLCIFGSPYGFGELAPVGYIFLFVMSSLPDSVLVLLKMLISLFFCLLVGSKFTVEDVAEDPSSEACMCWYCLVAPSFS